MILIVDDDPSVRASLTLLLKHDGRSSRAAASAEEAIALIESSDQEPFELVLQDMNFSRATSGEEGLALLKTLRRSHPALPIILMTAWGSIPLAVEGMKAGANDFLTKPFSNDTVLSAIDTALRLAASQPTEGSTPNRAELDESAELGDLIGGHPAFLRVLAVVARVSPTNASVLITGESGTGKERIAEAIHRNSRRAGRPFVKVNLGGISSTLFESEMFGHVRGAYTDATSDRRGRFELADGGTIFLDEIGELDPSAQVKLLRVLQDRTYEVLGSSTTRTVDVRVISATNRDLAEAVRRGAFREDLLYRLNLISVHAPPLRERPEDIPLLASHFLAEIAASYRRAPVTLTPAAASWLSRQPFPGNVRQLRQTIERALLMLDGDRVDRADLETLADLATREEGAGELPAAGAMTLDEIEQRMIDKCMRQFSGNISQVAEALGLTRQALYRRLKKYGIGT